MTCKEVDAAKKELEQFMSDEHTVQCFTDVKHGQRESRLVVLPYCTGYLDRVERKLREMFGHIPEARIAPFHVYSYIVQVPITT